jgi:hypothetical protein
LFEVLRLFGSHPGDISEHGNNSEAADARPEGDAHLPKWLLLTNVTEVMSDLVVIEGGIEYLQADDRGSGMSHCAFQVGK